MILHPFTQAIWRYISKHISGKNHTNPLCILLYGLRRHIWKCTAEQKSNKCNFCNYASTHTHILMSHMKKMCFSHTCVVNFTYNPRTTCVVFTTYVYSFTHMCGNNHTHVEIPHRQVLGFYHTCVVKHTHRLISPWTNGDIFAMGNHQHKLVPYSYKGGQLLLFFTK